MTNPKPPDHHPPAPASHHRHGLDSPSTYPTQGQHPAPAHSRPAPEDSRGTPAPKRKDRGRQQHQSPRPTPRRERKQGKAREKQAASTCTQSQPRRAQPAGGQRTASPSPCNHQPDSRASTTQGTAPETGGRERGERRERERGTARK